MKGERKPQTPQLSLQVWAMKKGLTTHMPRLAQLGQRGCSSTQPLASHQPHVLEHADCMKLNMLLLATLPLYLSYSLMTMSRSSRQPLFPFHLLQSLLLSSQSRARPFLPGYQGDQGEACKDDIITWEPWLLYGRGHLLDHLCGAADHEHVICVVGEATWHHVGGRGLRVVHYPRAPVDAHTGGAGHQARDEEHLRAGIVVGSGRRGTCGSREGSQVLPDILGGPMVW